MRTIANLKGEEFLMATYNVIEAVEKFNNATGVMAIWKSKPTYTGEETPEEKHEIMKKQIQKNWRDMLKSALHTNAKATYEFIMALFVLEDDEDEPDGMEMLLGALDIITDERVIAFFIKLWKSGVLGIVA